MARQLLTALHDRTGASEVVGIVLLIGLVLVAATFVFVVGSSTLHSAESQIELDAAEQSVDKLNTELKSVSSKQANATTDFKLRSNEATDVKVQNNTSIFIRVNYRNGYESRTIDNVRSLVYTHGDGTRIVSQAGAVWRVGDAGTKTVTAPPLEYSNGSLFFNIVKPTGRLDPTDGTVRVRRDAFQSRSSTEALYDKLITPDPTGEVRLPENITIEVQESHQDAWQRYFNNTYGDDPRVTVGPEQTTFELLSSVEAGTPTDETAYSVTDFANQSSKHVFQHTVDDSFGGNLSEISVTYTGDVNLTKLETQDINDSVQSIGVDTTGNGYLDTTAGIDAIETLDVTGSGTSQTVTIDLKTGADEPTIPISGDDTVMLRYGSLQNGSVTNPLNASNDSVILRIADDQGGTTGPVDGDLDLKPEIDPLSVDGEELVVRGRNITVENVNTAFEETSTKEGKRIPVDVVVVSDQSGSMNNNDPNGLRPDATNAFIEKLANTEPDDRVATVHFSAKCFDDNHDSKKIEGLQAAENVSADHQPRDERADCNTNYHAGFQTALNILEGRSEKNKTEHNAAIVFMGDGGHNADEVEYDSTDEYEFDEFPSEANIRDQAREANDRNITVHTIGFSEGIDDDARQLLDDMADITGGTTQFPEQASDLEETFEEVADDVTKPSHFLNREPVSVTASIDGKQYTFDGAGSTFQPGTGTPSTNEPLYDPQKTLQRQKVPGAEVPSAQEIRNGESVRLALTLNEHGCDEDGDFEGPFSPETIGTKKYTRQVCESIDSSDAVRTIGPGDSRYFVLTAGDTLDDDKEDTTGSWQPSLDDAVDDAGLTTNGELDLSEREALVVARAKRSQDQKGYAAFVVRTTPVELATEDLVAPGKRRLFGISVQEVELQQSS
jgi:hypothetical protein